MDNENETIDTIRDLARRFRLAIEAVPAASRLITMKDFPRGSCGDASLLLGAYFVDQGVRGFRYICGERGNQAQGNWTSHAWLQRGDLVVDITADQFEDGPDPVMVEAPSEWHKQFDHEEPTSADFRDWTGPGTYELPSMYARVKSRLK